MSCADVALFSSMAEPVEDMSETPDVMLSLMLYPDLNVQTLLLFWSA